MPDIYLYDVDQSNPADVVLYDPTILSANINTSVRPTGARVLGLPGNLYTDREINVLLYQGEAVGTDVKLRYIGLIEAGGGTNVDVFVTGNIATGLVGTVTVTGDANISISGSLATGLVHSVTVTGDANVTTVGNLATGLVGTVTITGDATVTTTGTLATGLVGTVTIDILNNTAPLGTVPIRYVLVDTANVVPVETVVTNEIGTVSCRVYVGPAHVVPVREAAAETPRVKIRFV